MPDGWPPGAKARGHQELWMHSKPADETKDINILLAKIKWA
jgi:hypothetical protein